MAYCKQAAFNDLLQGSVHEGVLAKILLDGTQHDDLLQFLGTCAQVNRAWRSIVGSSAAYGLCLARTQLPWRKGLSSYEGDEDERARVLFAISTALLAARDGFEDYGEQRAPGTLDLDFLKLGNNGVRVLGATLQVVPLTSPAIENLCLSRCELTSTIAVEAILGAMRPGGACGKLKWLSLSENPVLGMDTTALLARSLPQSLQRLELERTACTDDGMVALARELPRLASLQALALGGNNLVTKCGWLPLIEALPSLPVLQELRLTNCGMECSSGRRIADVLPRCTQALSSFWLAGNHFDELTVSELRVAWGARLIGGIAFARDWQCIDSDDGESSAAVSTGRQVQSVHA